MSIADDSSHSGGQALNIDANTVRCRCTRYLPSANFRVGMINLGVGVDVGYRGGKCFPRESLLEEFESNILTLLIPDARHTRELVEDLTKDPGKIRSYD